LAGKTDLAKKALSPYIRNALDILTDEDPENDNMGYKDLASSFTRIDAPNAIAAWSLMGHSVADQIDGKTALDTNGEDKSDNESEDKKSKKIFYNCDGGCGHKWYCGSEMYVCRDCLDIQFHPPCYEKFRKGEISSEPCDPSHEFIYVPKCNTHMHDGTQTDTVKVNDEVMKIKDWLDLIAREYGVETART